MKDKGKFNRENVTEAVQIFFGHATPRHPTLESAVDEIMNVVAADRDPEVLTWYDPVCMAELRVYAVRDHPSKEYALSTWPIQQYDRKSGQHVYPEEGMRIREEILHAWEEAGFPTNRKKNEY